MTYSVIKNPEKSLFVQKPFLVDQWDYTKNFPLTPKDVFANGAAKVWWICSKGHEWETYLYSRQDSSCKFCLKEKPSNIRKDWASKYPKIAKEWHPTKNKNPLPLKGDYRIDEKAWWICDQGHEWEAIISNRAYKGISCTICSGRNPNIGVNDLATLRPDIILFWAWELNNTNPSEYKEFSNEKVYWKCVKGHITRDSINHKTNGRGCKFCSNKAILVGFNDLAATHPLLAAEWDFLKNTLLPTEIFGGNIEKRWWVCSKGHSYDSSANKRTFYGRGCPYCSNQKILIGYNDLATTAPEVLDRWDYSKNINYTPQTVGRNMKTMIWWVCSKGHEWQRRIRNQCNSIVYCPECSLVHTSAIEYLLFKNINTIIQNSKSGQQIKSPYQKSKTSSVDIIGVYENILLAIEYDGSYWHQGKEENDINKTKGLIEQGYLVIRIRENKLQHLNYTDSKLIQITHNYKDHIDVLLKSIKSQLVTYART